MPHPRKSKKSGTSRPPPGAVRRMGAGAVMKLGLVLFALAAVVALLLDLHTISRSPTRGFSPAEDIRRLRAGLHGPRYVDPHGRFSLVEPAGWQKVLPPRSEAYDVIFRGPCGTELRIMTRSVPYSDFDSLVRQIRKSQKRFGIYPEMQPVKFHGLTALRRRARLFHAQIMTLDFVRDGVEHHILFSSPPDLFSNYLPVIEQLLETYRIGAPRR